MNGGAAWKINPTTVPQISTGPLRFHAMAMPKLIPNTSVMHMPVAMSSKVFQKR